MNSFDFVSAKSGDLRSQIRPTDMYQCRFITEVVAPD